MTNAFAPKIIHIDLTGKCNFKCLHCRGRFSNEEISEKEIKRIIEEILKFWKKDVEWFELGGGEPLIYPHLFKTITHIKKNSNSKIIIVSNGYFFNKEYALKLKKLNLDRIQFSLDGTNSKTHNWLRQNSFSFKRVIEAAHICKQIGLPFVLRMTINNKNKSQIERFFQLSKSLGAVEVGLRGCVYVGNAEKNCSDLFLNKCEYAKILTSLPSLSKKYDLPYFSGDPLALIANKSLLKRIKNKFGSLNHYSGCCVGISYLYINNKGNISFCPMLNNIEIGNLKTNSIKNIWDNCPEFIKMRNRDMEGKCKTCTYLKLCGGCCAYGYWKSKKLFSENPICCFHKTIRR